MQKMEENPKRKEKEKKEEKEKKNIHGIGTFFRLNSGDGVFVLVLAGLSGSIFYKAWSEVVFSILHKKLLVILELD